MDGYFIGPHSSNGTFEVTNLDSDKFMKTIENSMQNCGPLLTNPSAVSALGELSPGGILMKSFHHHSAERK